MKNYCTPKTPIFLIKINYFFRSDTSCERFIAQLKRYKRLRKFRIYAFCILYDHAHLLIQPVGKFGVREILNEVMRKGKPYNQYVIQSKGDFERHYDYVVQNHIEHGYPNNYKYTSQNFMEIVDKIKTRK